MVHDAWLFPAKGARTRPMQETREREQLGILRGGHPERVMRYKSAEWATLRARQLREHPTCQWPGCTAPATQVDHRRAVADGGAFAEPLNLQSICKAHHHIKTALDAKRRAKQRKE